MGSLGVSSARTFGTEVLRWPSCLPPVGVFDPGLTPQQTALSIVGALQHDGEDLQWVLGAASRVRSWWSVLDDRGQRLDPYPDLTGDGYLWISLRLVAAAAALPTADGTWNMLRRAEANLRAWSLEHLSSGYPAAIVEQDDRPG